MAISYLLASVDGSRTCVGAHDDLALLQPFGLRRTRLAHAERTQLGDHGLLLSHEELEHAIDAARVEPVVVDGDRVLEVLDLVVPTTSHE